MSDTPASGIRVDNVSGDVNVAGDMVGRDKVTNIINVAAGARVTVGANGIEVHPEVAATGLMALAALMRAPEVFAEVITFRNDFQATQEKIEELSAYKALHDALHRLKFNCYDTIYPASLDFPADASINSRHQVEFEGIIDELLNMAERGRVGKQELVWINRLKPLPEELEAAISTEDKKRLDLFLRKLKRELDLQPAQINKQLNTTARTLRLLELVTALTKLRDNLTAHPELDAQQVNAFRSGVEALTTLGQQLTLLVDDHDGWQAAEAMLTRIEDLLELDTQELVISWGDLKTMTVPLAAHRSERRAQAFQKSIDALDAELTGGDVEKIKQAFFNYRNRAGDLFYQTDMELLRLSGELRKVGEPLATVLRMTA